MAWNFHAIEQTQLRRRYRVDGVGRPRFDFHTGNAAEAVAETEKRRVNPDAPWEREIKELTVCAHVDTFSRVPGHKKGDHHPLEPV